MTTQNILWIIAITIIALLVAIFQYFFKAKRNSKRMILFAFLRFLSVFAVLLLLVNPKITVITSTQEKPELNILVDQSQSITYLKQTDKVKNIVNSLKNNKDLHDKFELFVYGFGAQLTDTVTNDFKESQTKIHQVLSDLQKVHRKENSPIVLISDGNQTYGQDYSYYKSKFKQPIYSVPLGDTTSVADVKITTVNANKYVYLDNEFPVEVLANYKGEGTQESTLEIYRGAQKIYSKQITFSENRKSFFITPKLKANKAGLHNYKIVMTPFKNEKNQRNNTRQILVETIDQKTSIVLVSSMVHPDIGALKRSIEGNQRRRLKVVSPSSLTSLDDAELVILYQPNRTFKNIYEMCEKAQMPLLTITGKKTDWNFINSLKRNYSKLPRTQVEEVLPVVNSTFEIFNTNTFDFEGFPPLESTFGEETLQPSFETLLFKKVAGVTTQAPLLAFWNTKTTNEAVLLGEGLWKWRILNFKKHGGFKEFDDFLGKIIQYLSNKKARKRLTINYENEFYTNSSVVISASYFNKNYEFDNQAKLSLQLTKEGEKEFQEIAMPLKGSFYEAEFSNLKSGVYRFTVTELKTNQKAFGSFVVRSYDIEKQYETANIGNLEALVTRNQGALVFNDKFNGFVDELIKDPKLKPTITYHKEDKPLIEWHYLLGVLLFLLGLEWFLRKYTGLV